MPIFAWANPWFFFFVRNILSALLAYFYIWSLGSAYLVKQSCYSLFGLFIIYIVIWGRNDIYDVSQSKNMIGLFPPQNIFLCVYSSIYIFI